MADVAVLSAKALEATQGLHERVSAKKWSDFSRTSFVYNTTKTINALEDLAVLFEEMSLALKEKGAGERTDISGHLNEINSLMVLLQRNKELESAKIQKAREKGIELLAEDVIVSDQYSSLEQKVLGLVLKTRYLLERINIHTRKEESRPFLGSKSTKDVLSLLSEKEDELQTLREKYEKLKHSGLVARLAENTASDIEHELNEFSRKLHSHSQLLSDSFESNKKRLTELGISQKQLEEKIKAFDELQRRHFEKSLELVTLLKKERDFAKKLVLDIESETLALRNTYSQKLLGLEQEKAQAKSEAFENFRKQLSKQESELKEKTELISSLREAVVTKEQAIKKLEWQIKKAQRKKK